MLIADWSDGGGDKRNPSESEFWTEVPTREEQKLLSQLVQTKIAYPSVPSTLLAKDPSGDPVEVKTNPRCLAGFSTGFPSQFHAAGMELVAGKPHGLEGLTPIKRLQIPPAPPGLCSVLCCLQAFFELTFQSHRVINIITCI